MEYHDNHLFVDDDDDDDPDRDFLDSDVSRELLVYMIDASFTMFLPSHPGMEDQAGDGASDTCFRTVLKAITKDLKTRIISRERDEVAICFFNTREKKNLQGSDGVFVFQASDQDSRNQDEPCQPTARLIKEFSHVDEFFDKAIGSKVADTADSPENPLYNALWVAQGLLRKGSVKNSSKRIFIFTNQEDPFDDCDPEFRKDMRRTTIQRARDAQDLGISIEIFPFSKPGQEFNISIFYGDMLGMSEEERSNSMAIAAERLDIMLSQMQKKLFKKRTVRRLMLATPNGMNIGICAYALFRPQMPGRVAWLDSFDNKLLKSERSLICSDTGTLLSEPLQCFQEYKSEKVCFSPDEVAEVKNITNVQLQLLGFKPLECLREYHNLRPASFLYPDEEKIKGSTCAFIALYRAMLRFKKYGVAFLGSSCRMVALMPQAGINNEIGQIEPSGIHMIYLPYSDDIRHIEKMYGDAENNMSKASANQIQNAMFMLKRIDLKDFTYANYSNPALQRHYAILEAFALGEDDTDLPDPKDDTMPPEEQMEKQTIMQTVKAFKDSVYGPEHDVEEDAASPQKLRVIATSQKRKAAEDDAANDYDKYDWEELAEKGKLKELTVTELKIYLMKNKLPATGKKDVIINRILTHLGK